MNFLNFLDAHQSQTITIFVLLLIAVFIPLFIFFIRRGRNKVKRMIQLKNGEIQSKEIIGKVKAIEYGFNYRARVLGPIYITNWYLIIEGKDPLTNNLHTYISDYFNYNYPQKFARRSRPSKKDLELFYQHINKLIKIDDKVKIIVSLKNTNDYYMPNLKFELYPASKIDYD